MPDGEFLLQQGLGGEHFEAEFRYLDRFKDVYEIAEQYFVDAEPIDIRIFEHSKHKETIQKLGAFFEKRQTSAGIVGVPSRVDRLLIYRNLAGEVDTTISIFYATIVDINGGMDYLWHQRGQIHLHKNGIVELRSECLPVRPETLDKTINHGPFISFREATGISIYQYPSDNYCFGPIEKIDALDMGDIVIPGIIAGFYEHLEETEAILDTFKGGYHQLHP